jgi:hypothetical protein
VEGKEMNAGRFNHFSIVCDGTLFVLFGTDPAFPDEPQDGVEYTQFNQILKQGGSWYIPQELQKEYFKLTHNYGILPDPYSKRIVIFGKKKGEEDGMGFFDDSDEDNDNDKDGMFVLNFDDPAVDVYKRHDYPSKFTFDTQNLPLFYKGIYYVFGEDLGSIMTVKREFKFK